MASCHFRLDAVPGVVQGNDYVDLCRNPIWSMKLSNLSGTEFPPMIPRS